MKGKSKMKITNLKLSLEDLLGGEYVNAVCESRAFLENRNKKELLDIATEKIEFWPDSFSKRADELLEFVGKKVCPGMDNSSIGAATASFQKATNKKMAPLSGSGFIRVGEDGRAYLVSKSEHYHASLGHNFPGYKLIDNARKLGILNATHNNSRGHITRLVEEELVRVANGIRRGDREKLDPVLNSQKEHCLNKVINLETGSLAVEAALKMMLARFYRLDKTYAPPKHEGKIPVFIVMGDNEGGKIANYHGTTIITQTLRGMWPELYETLESNNIYRVATLRINDIENFRDIIKEFDNGKYKVAGFFHEIILMNYGGIRLTEEFLKEAYEICDAHDIPTIVDEIQSCIWSPELFQFREYGLNPDFVSIGKGFPGGEYPASKILASSHMDNLNQFGALVTNGQEELASLAYLITIAFAEANSEYTREIGNYYEEEIKKLGKKHPDKISRTEGKAHLSTIFFHTPESCTKFVKFLLDECIDVSAQTYKAQCPPAALTKIPLVSSFKMVDFLIGKFEEAMRKT
jgi:acetylornithine/succinyldiaminopimelate/putrescine aminotransferase